MKVVRSYLFILVIILCSCRKHNDIIRQDRILYSGLIDSNITSIDSISYIGRDDDGDCYAPYPIGDTTVEYNLDLNNDGKSDFQLFHTHWYGTQQVSMHTWCANYQNYSVDLSSNNDNEICASHNVYSDSSSYLLKNDVINDNLRWISGDVSALISGAWCECSNSTFDGEGYIGLRVHKSDSTYYGWLHVDISDYGITVKDYAINLTGNQSIRAGQKE